VNLGECASEGNENGKQEIRTYAAKKGLEEQRINPNPVPCFS